MKLNFHLHNNLLLHVFTFLVSQNIFTSYIKTARIVITIVNNARKFGIILKKTLGYVILSISKERDPLFLNFTFVCDVRSYCCIPV